MALTSAIWTPARVQISSPMVMLGFGSVGVDAGNCARGGTDSRDGSSGKTTSCVKSGSPIEGRVIFGKVGSGCGGCDGEDDDKVGRGDRHAAGGSCGIADGDRASVHPGGGTNGGDCDFPVGGVSCECVEVAPRATRAVAVAAAVGQ